MANLSQNKLTMKFIILVQFVMHPVEFLTHAY